MATDFVLSHKFNKKQNIMIQQSQICFHHEGNHQFRALIGEHADTYKMAPTKKQKMLVIALVTDIILARGGRFLVQSNGAWSDAGRKVGKKKVGGAFRDALRGRVKCISQIINKRRSEEHSSSDWSETHSESSEESDAQSPLNLLAIEPFQDWEMTVDVSDIEPSKDWMNPMVDNEVADDLLNFFLTDVMQ